MSIYDVVQWLIIVALVLISALYTLGLIVPRWRKQLAQHLQQPRYAHWINRFGVRIAGGGGCGSCDTCGSCATPSSTNKK